MRYTAVLLADPEEDGYTAFVPALPGCVSEGDTLEEALAMIEDAAAGYLVVSAERGEEIPEEAPGTVVVAIDVPAPVAEAVA
jgi:predicted RNase H-like HicB family nuclease